ncbi:MAG: hypothetical protein FWG81_10445 [Betaproteobacteria bacterium]|nr:hypothetical protein [Betaproteobacteria bacterium]
MNIPRRFDPFGDLPVLTEVVVPSPSGIRMPDNTSRALAPAEPEAPVFGQKAGETQAPTASQPLAKTAPFPALNPEYMASVTSGMDEAEDEPDIDMDEDSPEPAPATQGEDVFAAPAISEIREALVEALQKRFAIEIPTLVEAALQNALPMITHDIREGLEENAKLALKDLIASLQTKSSPFKKR